jgi:Short C-terminal domain
LLGTMARTAVVAGTATAVSGGVMRRQQARSQQAAEAAAYQQQQQEAEMQAQMQQYAQQATAHPGGAGPAAPAGGTDITAKLKELADLRTAGVLSDAEFAAAKTKLLGV